MELHVERGAIVETDCDWLIVGIPQDEEWPTDIIALDASTDGLLARLRERSDLSGKLGQLVPIFDPAGLSATRLLLVGLGPASDCGVAELNRAVMTAARRITSQADQSVAILVTEGSTSLSASDVAQTIGEATEIAGVGQGLYRAESARHPLAKVTILTDGTARDAVERGVLIGECVNVARELVNRVPAEIYPESVADRCATIAEQSGLECEVFDEKRMQDERMGSLLAVAVGSTKPPRLVALHHRGGGDGPAKVAFCGKGVTFDSGGLSLKTSEGMKTMKADMAGAATVVGAMAAIAKLKLPVNVTGYIGLVENMPSGSSYKLGDVLTARNGVTIEVLNTDAEGRLVLADVLAYAVDHGAERLVDLATLTGACVVALGEDVAGAFSNHDGWCNELIASAQTCGELVWQMPMFPLYADLLKSDVADCKNIGGRWGGAITAAKFLEKFVDSTPWVHLDIAGPSFATGNKPHREGGATGCFVRTLVETAQRLA